MNDEKDNLDDAKAVKELAKAKELEQKASEIMVELEELTNYDVATYERVYADNKKYSNRLDLIDYYMVMSLIIKFSVPKAKEWTDDMLGFALATWSRYLLTKELDVNTILLYRLNIATALIELSKRDKEKLYQQLVTERAKNV